MPIRIEDINATREFLIKEELYLSLMQKKDTVIYQDHNDIDSAVDNEPTEEGRDELKLLLASIFEISLSRHEYCLDSGSVPESNILATYFIPNARTRLDHLTTKGILQRSYIYFDDGRSENVYQISYKYETTQLKERRLNTFAAIEAAQNMYLWNLSGAMLYPELFRYHLDRWLRIDIKKIEAITAYDTENPDGSDPAIINHINLRQYILFSFANKRIQFAYDPVTGKLHTSLNFLSYYPETWLYTTYKGIPLTTTEAIDYKLFMLAALLDYDFWGFDPLFKEFVFFIAAPAHELNKQFLGKPDSYQEPIMSFNEFVERIGPTQDVEISMHQRALVHNHKLTLSEIRGGDVFLNTLYATPMTPLQARAIISLFNMEERKAQHDDVNRYRDLVSKSRLMDDLLDSLPIYDVNYFRVMSNSEEARLSLGNTLFDESFSEGKTILPLRYAFRIEFPVISTFLRWLTHNNKRLLPDLLNKMEAHVLLERICGQFIKNNPERFVSPIMVTGPAYRVLTSNDDVQYAGGAISDVLEDITGIAPMLYSRPWESDWDDEEFYE